jgi:hypothetical protein
MPHLMMNRTKDDGRPHMHPNPFMVSMRYQCECTGGEVLTLSTVFDLEDVASHTDEELFIWIMKRMFRDMKIEIAQHLKTKPSAE